MAKKPYYAGQPADEAVADTETPEPIEIVDLDAAIEQESLTPEQAENGVNFWFGEVGLIQFPDKTTYAANKRRAFITDPVLIEKLKKASENPSHKIFIE